MDNKPTLPPSAAALWLADLERRIAEAEKEFTQAQLKESYWNCIVRERRQKVRDLKRQYKASKSANALVRSSKKSDRPRAVQRGAVRKPASDGNETDRGFSLAAQKIDEYETSRQHHCAFNCRVGATRKARAHH